MTRLLITALYTMTVFTAQANLPAFDQEALNAFWDQNASPEKWEAALTQLDQQLEDTHRNEGVKSFTDNPHFTPWLYTQAWLRLGVANKIIRNNAELAGAFVALGKIPQASHLLIRHLRPADNAAKATEILTRIHLTLPEKTKDYSSLAVAYAIVFDQEFPKTWPHHQVKAEAVPVGNTDPSERYRFYIESNESKQLDLDLRELGPTELKFMVDSLISLDELRYAQKSKFSRSKLDKAFSSIIYDTPRVKTNRYTWTHPSYKLQDIEQNGGICVDQAYYGTAIGKGRGVPTLYFSGQGSDGGHAWFGFMARQGKWELDCGRYESQNYPIGYATDPQNWRPINDAELEYLFRDLGKNPNEQASQAALVWAFQKSNNQQDLSTILSYYENARNLAPENPELWKYQRFFLDKLNPEPERLRTFYESWIQQFAKNSDMKVEGQNHLLEVLTRAQDPLAADLKKDIIRENRRKRFDLGIGVGAGTIFEQLEAKNWVEAEKEFKKMVRKFDDKGGGNLFYQIIQPYVTACLEEGQKDMAEDALKYADKKIDRDQGSILDKEFEKLYTAVDREKK